MGTQFESRLDFEVFILLFDKKFNLAQ